MKHKGIEFFVEKSDKDAFYQFRFEIADKIVRGKTRTRLAEWAARRARRAINWKLNQLPKPQDV